MKLSYRRLKQIAEDDTGQYEEEMQEMAKRLLLIRKYLTTYATTAKVRDELHFIGKWI